MNNLKKLLVLFFIPILMLACTGEPSTESANTTLSDEYFSDMYGYNHGGALELSALGRSTTLCNYLDSYRTPGQDSGEGNWHNGRKIQQEDMQRISDIGFNTVNINIRWVDYMEKEAPYSIIDTGDFNIVNRVKEIVGWANEAGLKCAINLHNYHELYREEENLSANTEKLIALWDQLSKEFPISEYPADMLYFYPLSEPQGLVGVEELNGIMSRLTETIWVKNAEYQTDNITGAQRNILFCPVIDTVDLSEIEIPDNSNPDNTIVILLFSYPVEFTFQGTDILGKSYPAGVRWTGTAAEQRAFQEELDTVLNNIQKNYGDFEILLAHCAVWSDAIEEMDEKNYTAFFCREAERRGLSWSFWSYDLGRFSVFYPDTYLERKYIVDALIPKDA